MQWLLYLACEEEPEVVVLSVKILARLLVVNGSGYGKKFAEKNGGYTVLKHHLRRWWNIPALWPICFAILFGQDVASLDLERPFDASEFLSLFVPGGYLRIVYPEMLPVIMEMLKTGLRSSVMANDHKEASTHDQASAPTSPTMSAVSVKGKS